ncbi:hypothetical protein FRB96_005439 [Tulasnella sp. 330]|nr:hypothetical protein FRB96_005439 [Tulasnella sp. 330]
MVLGITFRRRKTIDEPPPLPFKPSPSLPALTPTGLSPANWPVGLIDIQQVKNDVDTAADSDPNNNLNRQEKANASEKLLPSFGSPGKTVTPYHRPFKAVPGDDASAAAQQEDGIPRMSIASIYASPPSSFPRSSSVPATVHSPQLQPGNSRRITRVPPRFNVMIAGGLGAGKTSFLKLFLNTCDVSPTASESETAHVKRFLEAPTRHTKNLKSLSVEVCEDRHERVQLTLIDTVGFDFDQGRELELQLGVSSVMKYLDQQFADSMLEESKVVRKNKGDQHIHLCIYLINPNTIMRPSARREKGALRILAEPQPTVVGGRDSPSSIPSQETFDTATSEEEDDDDDVYGEPSDDDEGPEAGNDKKKLGETEFTRRARHGDGGQTMCPAELRVMQRLAKRCNVLPVIAHADTLTEERLELVRQVVRREVEEAGIGFSVFDTMDASDGSAKKLRHGHGRKKSNTATSAPAPPLPPLPASVTSNTIVAANATSGDDTDEERVSRPVIKLRSPGRTLERSRSRRRMLAVDEDVVDGEPETRTVIEGSSSMSLWAALPKAELSKMLPFTVISPEEPPHTDKASKPRRAKATATPTEDSNGTTRISDTPDTQGTSEVSTSDTGATSPSTINDNNGDHHPSTAIELTRSPKPDSIVSTRTSIVRRRPSLREYKAHIRSPQELRGKFTRKYRWGTIDALDPKHCDFVALRTAVLGTHMRALRNSTKEVLYENFRTEKLLARRATQSFNEMERQKMLQGA